MYKILVCGFTDNTVHGGLESAIMNYYRRFNLKNVQLDFICNSNNPIEYNDEIKKLGGKVFYTAKRGNNPIRYYIEMKKLFKKIAHNYDCLWFNTNDLSNIFSIKLAKKYGIKRIIVHSNNSQLFIPGIKGKVYKKAHYLHRSKIDNYATDFWACSHVAAKWMFPKNIQSQVKIVRNAISLQKTQFNEEKRTKIRKKLGLDSSFVIGHVGRLNFQKNQKFIVDLFPKIKEKIPNAKVVLVGDGEDKDKIIDQINQNNLNKDILVVGQKKDMDAWYSAFDMLLFPSLFEGLSVALLEAQANGLPILASDRVSPNEISINSNILFLSLNAPTGEWVNKIRGIYTNQKRLSDKVISHNFKEKKYNIDIEAARLEKEFVKSNF